MHRLPKAGIVWPAWGAMILVAGCSGRVVGPTARPDVLRISYDQDPETLNPIIAGDAIAALFQSFVYEQLADRNMADPDELRPRLAEKWTFDEKRLEYTIHLRHGVK